MDYKFDKDKPYKVYDIETGHLIDEGILAACDVLSTNHRVEFDEEE